MTKLLGWNKTEKNVTRGYFLRAPDGLDPWWTITKHNMGYGGFYFTVERGGEHIGQAGTLFLAKQLAEDDAYVLLRNRGLKSNPRNPRGRDYYLTMSGKALPASDLAFIKKCAQAMRPNRPLKDTGWEAIAARPADAAILLTHKPNVEHAIFAYAAEKGGAHARYGKVPEGYRSKPTKVNPRGGGVNARGGWRHEKGSGVWLAKYATGPSYQIVHWRDGTSKDPRPYYVLEAGRWSKAADSFKGGVNSGVYRTLSEAQHEAGNMRRRWALGRQK